MERKEFITILQSRVLMSRVAGRGEGGFRVRIGNIKRFLLDDVVAGTDYARLRLYLPSTDTRSNYRLALCIDSFLCGLSYKIQPGNIS
jgi:hypothetical protein